MKRYLFSSSACVYPDMAETAPEIDEDDAYPAFPDNEYGWEKLYAERMALAFGRRYGFPVRISRFQNCYGPEGTWIGGREKAPAAICRKVALADDGGEIEVWGDGTALRSYTHVDDLTAGICLLMQSDESWPTNIGRRCIIRSRARRNGGSGGRQNDPDQVCSRSGRRSGAQPFQRADQGTRLGRPLVA